MNENSSRRMTRASLPASNCIPSEWQSMGTAPKDGTAIQAEIPGNGSDNMIAWFDNLIDSNGVSCGGWQFVSEQEPPDSWTDGTCWAVNEDGVSSVPPTRWKLPRASSTATDGRPSVAAVLDVVILRSCFEKATAGPYCIESCGEKGDGSNIVGVAFHPDDRDAETPLTGWLEEADTEGNFVEYYRDEQVAEFEHRNRNANRDAEFLMLAYNNFPELLRRADVHSDLLDALKEMLDWLMSLPHTTNVSQSSQRSALRAHRKALLAIAKATVGSAPPSDEGGSNAPSSPPLSAGEKT